jgi:hypothetical protein
VELRSSGPDTRLPTMLPGAVSQSGEQTLVMLGKSQIESDVRSSIPLSGVKAGIAGSESRWKESITPCLSARNCSETCWSDSLLL